MTSAREEILARLRTATADVAEASANTPDAAVAERPVRVAADGPDITSDATLDLFLEMVADYRASVARAAEDDVGREVAAALARAGARRVAVPEGLPTAWTEPLRDSGIELVVDSGLGSEDLDAVDAVVTAARLGIATTGTIILDHGPDQGRRALTLVPDQHVCVVRAAQVVHDVPDAVALVDPARPLTWISGPSATSDIELTRVEGVHGPRALDVVVVTG